MVEEVLKAGVTGTWRMISVYVAPLSMTIRASARSTDAGDIVDEIDAQA